MRTTAAPALRSARPVALATVMALALTGCFVRPHDYDGDKKADIVYITVGPTGGAWMQQGVVEPLWAGLQTGIDVGGDYDNDGKWEPAELQGRDWVSSKLAAPIHYDPVGLPTATPDWPTGTGGPGSSILPVPADYDGDGDTDPAYYAVADGTWWISGRTVPTRYGTPPTHNGQLDWDVPVPADYDGDLKADIAVFHPTDHSFHILQSKTGTERVVRFPNVAALMPVPADYDGDGKSDPAAANTLGTDWWITPDTATPTVTLTSSPLSFQGGHAVVADYDGDGKADPAAYDAGTGVVRGWIGGAETTLTTLPTNPVVLPALPYAERVNIVRLTFYGKCLTTTDPTSSSPPIPNWQVCPPRPTAYDLDADRKADLAWTSADGTWHRLGTPTPVFSGGADDLIAPGDYDLLDAWEPATVSPSVGGPVWRTPTLTIPYAFPPSATPTYPTWAPFSGPQLLAVPGDYDGDHKDDPTYYVVATGQWWVKGYPTPATLGTAPSADGGLDWDVPVPGDYVGRGGWATPAVYRPSDSTFQIGNGGAVPTVIAVGRPGDFPVPADYDGDGKVDAATFRPSTGQWFIAGEATRTYAPPVSPGSSWIPAVADYDGDGQADLSLFDPVSGQWVREGIGTMATLAPGDRPIEIPQAIGVNAVRLAAYDRCLHDPTWHTTYPTHCPGAS
ncbi:MAG: FG-GAP repeat domain-containing protein [Acidimicrobiales bacterium]